jgi:hypothetical protein
MEGFNKTKRRFWCGYMAFLIVGIVIMAALALGGLINTARSEGAAADQPLCQAVLETSWSESVYAPEWVGYPGGWEGMPLGLFDQEPLILYLPGMESGYVIYRDQLGHDWIFPHYSFENGGTPPGTHDLCDVVVWMPG